MASRKPTRIRCDTDSGRQSSRRFLKCETCRRDSKKCWPGPLQISSQLEPGTTCRAAIPDGSIRLLHVMPANDDGKIHATLVDARLEDQPRYTALSYTWGCGEQMYPIIVNGKVNLIRENLAQALAALRHSKSERYFWIDEICINQQDAQELNSQIARMARIYKEAESVVVWLSGQSFGGRIGRQDMDNSLYKSDLMAYVTNALMGPSYFARLGGDSSYRPCGVASQIWSPSAIASSGGNLTLEEFTECQSLARLLFSACEELDFPYLSIVLSATQTSVRTLRLTEITRIIALLTATEMILEDTDKISRSIAVRGSYQNLKLQYLEEMIRNKWSGVLYVDSDDYVHFTRPSMGMFLSRLPGWHGDIKHENMANACMRELEFGIDLARSNQSISIGSHGPDFMYTEFSEYAMNFWQQHYEMAQHASPALSERLHVMIWDQIRSISHAPPAAGVISRPPCFEMCSRCTGLASDYCAQRGFTVLGKLYAQARERMDSKDFENTNWWLALDPGQELSNTLEEYHIWTDSEDSLDTSLSSGSEFSSVMSDDLEFCTDNAETGRTSDAEWLMVDREPAPFTTWSWGT